MNYADVLEKLTRHIAVSGNENTFSAMLKEDFEKFCDMVEIDRFFNVIGFKNGCGSSKKKIMITAHVDEIGLMVKSIDEKGFIEFTNIGGVDSKILPAQEVVIHGKKDLPGVIGAKPPHLISYEEWMRALKLDDLSIDTGLNPEEVKKYVSIGDVISLDSSFTILQGGKAASKSLDNRSGVAVLLHIMEQLFLFRHKSDLYFVATSQEEFDMAGAVAATYRFEPDAAIVIDTCHGDMRDVPKDLVYPLGKGPAVGVGPNLDKNLTQKMIKTGREDNIPLQIDTEPGNTGTEAWAVQVSRSGIPTVLVSIPLRYMHTAVETVCLEDIKNAAMLVSKFLIEIDSNDFRQSKCL